MATVEARSPHSGRFGASRLSVGQAKLFNWPLFLAPFRAPSSALVTFSCTTPCDKTSPKSLALKEKINSALYHRVELRDKAQVRNFVD